MHDGHIGRRNWVCIVYATMLDVFSTFAEYDFYDHTRQLYWTWQVLDPILGIKTMVLDTQIQSATFAEL